MVGDDIEIPDAVVVRCPLKRFDLARAIRCEGCTHFAGLTELMTREASTAPIPFHRAYAVRCAFPIDRELQSLAPETE